MIGRIKHMKKKQMDGWMAKKIWIIGWEKNEKIDIYIKYKKKRWMVGWIKKI